MPCWKKILYGVLLFFSLLVIGLSLQQWILYTPPPDDLLARFPSYTPPKATNRTPDLWAHIILLDRVHMNDDLMERLDNEIERQPDLAAKRAYIASHPELVARIDQVYSERIGLLSEICAFDDVYPYPQGVIQSASQGVTISAWKSCPIMYPDLPIAGALILRSESGLLDGDRTGLRRLISIHGMFCRMRDNLYDSMSILANILICKELEKYAIELAEAGELTPKEQAILHDSEANATSFRELTRRYFVSESWESITYYQRFNPMNICNMAKKPNIRVRLLSLSGYFVPNRAFREYLEILSKTISLFDEGHEAEANRVLREWRDSLIKRWPYPDTLGTAQMRVHPVPFIPDSRSLESERQAFIEKMLVTDEAPAE